jgi:hypothetical protein
MTAVALLSHCIGHKLYTDRKNGLIMVRSNKEFSDTDLFPWQKIGEGLYEKILSRDEQTGAYTRLLKFEAGLETTERLVHDFYEEVYIVRGMLIDKTLKKNFTEGMYAFRNPGMAHGPYAIPNGCITFEVRYHEKK